MDHRLGPPGVGSLPDPLERLRARILATLGPASWSRENIESLVRAGAAGFRLNFSHGDHDRLSGIVAIVRDVSARFGRPLALLGDLSGPKLRTGEVVTADRGPLILVPEDEIVLTPDVPATTAGVIKVDEAVLAGDLHPGAHILLDDGKVELVVRSVEGRRVSAMVIHGGPLGRQKGVNIPGVRLRIPAITEKDAKDLEFALAHGLDFIALSFVQDAKDVVDLKRRIAQAGHDTPVIAKIEKPVAVARIESILEVSDGIMVARGDLGVELGPEELPVVQKRLIAAARRHGKLVITATQMLESMIENPRPTRAEASDVANALFDGSDVVMLSGETAMGKYPVRAVETMRRIALSVEGSDLYHKSLETLQRPTDTGVAHAAVRAGCVAAEQLEARAVVPFTTSGWTAFVTATWRPSVAVHPCTPSLPTYQRLALCWGTRPVTIPHEHDVTAMYIAGVDALLKAGLVAAGDLVVLLSGSVVFGKGANTIRLYRVGSGDLTDDFVSRDRLRKLVPQDGSSPRVHDDDEP